MYTYLECPRGRMAVCRERKKRKIAVILSISISTSFLYSRISSRTIIIAIKDSYDKATAVQKVLIESYE